MKIDKFIEEVKMIGINPTKEQLNQLDHYYEMLIEYNKVMNLTGITDHDEVYLKHFYDSATLNKVIDLTTIDSMCDVGTGAGFPGLVIKILFPNIKMTLLDSLGKRITFLNNVVKELCLSDIQIINARAEEYSKDNREKFDLVTARAVANLSILLEYSIPMVKVGKYFVAMKSDVEQELTDSKSSLYILNSTIIKKDIFNLPIENSKRALLLIQKNKETNARYPRKYADIKKKPL